MMISQLSSNNMVNSYANNKKELVKDDNVSINQQGDTSKVDMLKKSIEDGSYQVDLQELAKKIASELM